MSETEKILKAFFEKFDKMSFTIRDPPSKGQRELQALVKSLRYNVQLNEGNR